MLTLDKPLHLLLFVIVFDLFTSNAVNPCRDNMVMDPVQIFVFIDKIWLFPVSHMFHHLPDLQTNRFIIQNQTVLF